MVNTKGACHSIVLLGRVLGGESSDKVGAKVNCNKIPQGFI